MTTDSVLVHALRRGEYPAAGGTLCCAGDCPNCLATVDGVAYTRTCRTPHRDGQRVEPHPPHGQLPPLESRGDRAPVAARTLHCDVVVIGQGPAGRDAAEAARATGQHVVTIDSRDGQDAIGIYPGPLVVVRTDDGMRHLYPRGEIVVATGAAEILPVAPGNDLRGLVTARAAAELAAAGIPLGRVAAIGSPPEGVAYERADGDLVRFDASSADARHVGAIVMRRSDGTETRIECDTVSLGLGLMPRDALLRMARGMNVRGVGDVLRVPDLPPCPTSGVVCACLGVTVDDLCSVYARGFRELELVKALTTLGRPGVQVAAITRRAEGHYIVHVDSATEGDYPLVNGTPIGALARKLADNDVIQLAGVKMGFFEN